MKNILPLATIVAFTFLTGCVSTQLSNRQGTRIATQQRPAGQDAKLAPRANSVQSAEQAPAPADDAWKEVNCMDHDSVSRFLAAFPASSHTDEARLALVATEKLEAIRNKTSAPDYVIRFAKLGNYWEYWAARPKDLGVVGYAVGGFSPVVGGAAWFPGFTGGKTPGHNTFFNDNNAVPAMHTSDGSMAVFTTGGAKLGWVSNFYITTPENERLVFGVVDGVGLVYLAGVGQIVEPDGTAVSLPKKTASQ